MKLELSRPDVPGSNVNTITNNSTCFCVHSSPLRWTRFLGIRRIRGRNRSSGKNAAFILFACITSFFIICHFLMQVTDITSLDPSMASDDSSSDDGMDDELEGKPRMSLSSLNNNNNNNIVTWERQTTNVQEEESDHKTRMIGNKEEEGKSLDQLVEEQGTPGTRRRLPQCLIVGVRKAGTRALLEFLSIHPSIKKARDEVHFFDEDSKYALGHSWYREQMPPSSLSDVTIEKSPAYFVTESAPSRVHAMNSSIKLIVIVRDPVTRLISDYAQLAANKRARRVGDLSSRPIKSFEKSVLLPNGQVDVNYKPIQTSIYGLYFSRWLQWFPSNQIHVVDGDELIRDPFPEVVKIESFLGLDSRIQRDNFSFNATKGFFCVKLKGSETQKCLNESKGRRHPSVQPHVLSLLRSFYAPFNQRFFAMIDRTFNWPQA